VVESTGGLEVIEGEVAASAGVSRSNRAEVRNPLLMLVSAELLQALPKDSRDALRALLMDLRRSAHEKAEHSWKTRKGPLALYWRCVAVYAGHISRLLRDQPRNGAPRGG
jgi:hypothetical protein